MLLYTANKNNGIENEATYLYTQNCVGDAGYVTTEKSIYLYALHLSLIFNALDTSISTIYSLNICLE